MVYELLSDTAFLRLLLAEERKKRVLEFPISTLYPEYAEWR